jgi:hypothetical protein
MAFAVSMQPEPKTPHTGAILLGGAHGRLTGNRHLEAKPGDPTANLLLAIGHLADVDMESIGPSTGRFDL